MPAASVSNRTFEELFSSNVRYEIPFFQRGYACEKRQWTDLFTDLDEQIIDELIDDDFENHEHFFGPIVVLERFNSDPQLRRFLVIDGQQRITTVYLILALISEQLRAKKHLSQEADRYINELERFIKNDTTDKTDDYKKLKVFSNKGDRLPTYHIVFNNENPVSASLGADLQLFIPDQNRIGNFAAYATKKLKKDYSDIHRLWQLSQAILKCLKIVWIPLDEDKDDPQAIFESLNDKGIPLSASELLCNYIFKPLMNDVTNQHETIHNEKWLKTIKEVDGDANYESYLRNLFSIGQNKMIGKGRRLYVFFKNKNKKLSEKTAMGHLNEISSCAKYYNRIINPTLYHHSNDKINAALIKIHQTNMDSCIPFLMATLREVDNNSIEEKEAIKIFKETLTLLVRRKICVLPVTKYDSFFPSLFDKIKDEPIKVEALKECMKNDGLYVSNQEFKTGLIENELYRTRETNFTRYVLQEIDSSMQVQNQLPDYNSLETIEHIMPQTTDEEWEKYIGKEYEELYEYQRDEVKNSLGNLCLISGTANSSLGNNPFEKKKNSYTDVSALTRDIKEREVVWNFTAIKDRSNDLAKKALKIWKWTS